ncbi:MULTISPECIES: iron-containing redox enzyme family protein [Pseudoalteromonas]|uniref:iron-containing redox enzyme family protein n=1 Tax=Pseudoalteromonas TaxID=53246 RepID=UPI000FFECFF7|nr:MULTISPECIES: iron-containing redox enzyme family protein [Pseudoalteromonas]NKC20446.1 cupin domain-containing protein [Pseudoalteromonas galatheae]RXE86162.1 hypothetical protein DRB05_12110 [Pseudoalteromonas sp. A757]
MNTSTSSVLSMENRIGARFEDFVQQHRIWQNPLLKACENNQLTISEFGFVIAQHFYYSRGFTRLLSALMMQCENDLHRVALSHNLWEEAGEEEQQECHSNLLRNMLGNVFGVTAPDETRFRDYTVQYFNDCLNYLKHSDIVRAAAFLGWGTEGVVPKIYSYLFNGLVNQGVAESDLLYLSLHMECDDEHSEVIEKIALDACDGDTEQHWLAIEEAIDTSLSLRDAYFTKLYEELKMAKAKSLIDLVTSDKPYADLEASGALHANVLEKQGITLYQREDEAGGVNFEVTRFKVASEVIDPRLLEIPVGKRNEKHNHAHESVFYILSGQGRVHIDEKAIDVVAGELAYVPRWYDHYTVNTGSEPLRILALTDYGFTRCFPKNSESSYRNKPENLGHQVIG